MSALKVVEYPADSEEAQKILAEHNECHRELEQLRSNLKIHELNAATYQQNIVKLKGQVVDLQAQLLASQDRVLELQQKLLDVRAVADR